MTCCWGRPVLGKLRERALTGVEVAILDHTESKAMPKLLPQVGIHHKLTPLGGMSFATGRVLRTVYKFVYTTSPSGIRGNSGRFVSRSPGKTRRITLPIPVSYSTATHGPIHA